MIFLRIELVPRMIPFEIYSCLSLALQAEWLQREGCYLELIRRQGRLHIELYALGSFYVEVYFDPHSGEPLSLSAFEDVSYLDPYIALIEIEMDSVMK